HARKRPAVEIRRRRDGNRFAVGESDERLALQKRGELVELPAANVHELAGLWMLGFLARPCLERVAAVQTARHGSERLLCLFQLAFGDSEQPVHRQRHAFLETKLLLELVASEAKRSTRLRRHLGLEIA